MVCTFRHRFPDGGHLQQALAGLRIVDGLGFGTSLDGLSTVFPFPSFVLTVVHAAAPTAGHHLPLAAIAQCALVAIRAVAANHPSARKMALKTQFSAH
jgi:hypothetical protein